jgi:poly(3-hydroxybutyrate) depolymerase
MRRMGLAALAVASGLIFGGTAEARDYMGVACTTPQVARCSGDACVPALSNPGNAVDAKTGRKFFLDYPCDLKPGEKVTFILNIHGAGSIGNWQRHYFPASDYVNKYRLVVATPTAATTPTFGPKGPAVRVWVPAADDAHLQNIVDEVTEAFGKDNIRAFWLAGHSQGGITSQRIVCTPYFAGKVDGLLSLSGGRIGGSHMNPRFGPPKPDGSPPEPRPGMLGAATAVPACEFSHIYETGEHEITDLQATSVWAEKLGCGPRVKEEDIVDTGAGYVWDYARQGYNVWGMKARPGKAEEYLYPKCSGGRVVADFVRLDKGHTEGLEPKVTEAIVKLMVSAPGGKIAHGG